MQVLPCGHDTPRGLTLQASSSRAKIGRQVLHLRFGDRVLERAAIEVDYCPDGWSRSTVEEYRFVLQLIEPARALEELQALRLLRAAPSPTHGKDAWALSVGPTHRLIVKSDAAEQDVVVIRELVNHG